MYDSHYYSFVITSEISLEMNNNFHAILTIRLQNVNRLKFVHLNINLFRNTQNWSCYPKLSVIHIHIPTDIPIQLKGTT